MTRRRDFLRMLGAGGALTAAGIPAPLFAAEPGNRPVSDKWDMSWADRVNGKVRAVFDSPAPASGAALFRAQLWRDEYHDVYGGTPADTTAVIVFRHEAIPLVMNDAFWARFDIGKELKLRDDKGKKWARSNPIASAPAGTPAAYVNYNVPAFVGAGGIVLACNLAFGDMVDRFQKADKLSADAARTAALAHLLPGVILQPSGGFAVLRAQQAGCAYLLAS